MSEDEHTEIEPDEPWEASGPLDGTKRTDPGSATIGGDSGSECAEGEERVGEFTLGTSAGPGLRGAVRETDAEPDGQSETTKDPDHAPITGEHGVDVSRVPLRGSEHEPTETVPTDDPPAEAGGDRVVQDTAEGPDNASGPDSDSLQQHPTGTGDETESSAAAGERGSVALFDSNGIYIEKFS